jgi:hypothetical protein
MADDARYIGDAEVRANGGEVVYRGPLRVDDPRWPAEAARLARGLKIRDNADPNPKAWSALVFPDGSVRLAPGIARAFWYRGGSRED